MFRQSNRDCSSLGVGSPLSGASPRPGLALLELLIAMSIMVIVVGTLGTLANGIQQGFEYAGGHGTATQHARVILDRIAERVRGATANERFPGAIVVAENVESWRFPDTLVVWHPVGGPADPDGLPQYDELVIYCPNPSKPDQLVEITAPNDTRTVPLVENQTQWATEIDAIKKSGSSQMVILTDLMRTGSVGGLSTTSWRGAVRFETRLRPSASQWTDYQGGTLPWDEISWVQGIYGSQTGLRQVWLRMELQLIPGENVGVQDPLGRRAIAFLGSAALYYEMHK